MNKNRSNACCFFSRQQFLFREANLAIDPFSVISSGVAFFFRRFENTLHCKLGDQMWRREAINDDTV